MPISWRSSASSGRTSVLKASFSARVGAQDVAVGLGCLQRGAVDEQGFGRGLLHVHYRADLGLHFVLDVVALVEHECDTRPGLVRPCRNHLAKNAEQLVRVGRADEEVVVGIKAAVEMEPAEAAEAQQRSHDELDVGARRVVARVHEDVGFGPRARQWASDVPQSGTSIV